MLEFFRRHRGAFLWLLTAIIIITFSVWGGWTKGARDLRDQHETVFTIYGRDVTNGDVGQMQRQIQASMYLLQQYDFPQQLNMLSQQYSLQDGTQVDMFANLLVLRNEMEKNGLSVSDAEAQKELENLPVFQTNGQFDPSKVPDLKERLGSMGMTTGSLIEVMKDRIGLEKLRTLVSGSVSPSPLAISKSYAQQYQTVKMQTITFALEEFKKKAQVTDDEIKKYYDEKKDTYKTAAKRAAVIAFYEKPKDNPTPGAEKDIKALKEFQKKANRFNAASMTGDNHLEFLAAADKIKPIYLAPFEQVTPPDAIKAEANLIKAIFLHSKDGHRISDPVEGTNGYYFFTLTSVEDPRQQELAEVKDKIKDALALQKAQEAMTKAANEARDAIVAGLKEKKKISDVAKDKKLTLADQLEFSPSAPTPGMTLGREVTEKAAGTAEGDISTTIETDVGIMLVYVQKKELRKRDDSASLKINLEQSASYREQFEVFKAWFEQRRKEANVKLELRA